MSTPVDPPGDMVPEYDVIVVGSGLSGSLVADRLADARTRILVLEAGDTVKDRRDLIARFATSSSKIRHVPYAGLVSPQPYYSELGPDTPTFSARSDSLGRDYYVEQPRPEDGATVAQPPRAELLQSFYLNIAGGTTWHWQGLWLRMLPNDFLLQTAYQRGHDWPIGYDDLAVWYTEAERELGVSGDDAAFSHLYRDKEKPTYPMPPLQPSYLDRLFSRRLNGAAFLDYDSRGTGGTVLTPVRPTPVPQAKNSRRYDGRPACDGRSSCIPLCPTRAKYEARVHLERAQEKHVEVRARSVVNHLTALPEERGWRVQYRPWRWSNGRVERDGPDRAVTARVLVLAANGIETPKLLLLSDLGTASDEVGRNLMDHPVTIAWAQADEPVYPFRGPPTTSSIESLRDGRFRTFRGAFRTAIRNDGWAMANGAPNGWAPGPPGQASTLLDLVGGRKLFGRRLVRELFERSQRQILIGSAFEMLPDRKNRVLVDRTHLDDLGIPRPRIEFQVRDDPYTRATFEAAIRFHEQIFDAMGATERRLGTIGVPDGGSCHIMGTTMMGRDPRTSVVDAHCRLHGHPSLFVLGGSVFPTGTSANPTATVAALALRAVPTIRAELRGQRVPML